MGLVLACDCLGGHRDVSLPVHPPGMAQWATAVDVPRLYRTRQGGRRHGITGHEQAQHHRLPPEHLRVDRPRDPELQGVDYDMHAIAPPQNCSPEHLARHPWGKVPVFNHGDVELYETTAVCAYIDAAFDGPALAPSEPAALAKMHQVVSIANCYLYSTAVPRFILQFVFPSGPDGKPDEEVIEAAKPEIRKTLEVLDAALGGSKWFAGETISLADLFVAPLLLAIVRFPGGKELLAGLDNLARVTEQIVAEAKFTSAAPQS